MIECWLAVTPPDAHTIVAPVWSGDTMLGELHVSGVSGVAAQNRLTADALLVSHLVRQEDELERMTLKLVESHDQILALYDLNQTTRTHLEIEQTLQSLAKAATRLLNVASAFTILVVADSIQLFHHPAPLLDEITLFELFLDLQSSDHELLLSSERSSWLLGHQVQNVYLLPIRVRENAMSALGLLNKPGGFTSPDLKLARAITEQAAVQIEHVILYHEQLDQTRLQTEMDLARRVQLNLLPQSPPHVEGLDMHAESRPALQVGGDLYDFISQPARPLIFTVGDVAGKGMSAALMMAVTRTMIRSKVSTLPVITPEMLMHQVNEDLYTDFTEVGMFATMFIGAYDPECREITYTNAGHSPVIYRPAGGAARLLEADGTAIGVLPISLCDNHTLRFQSGDVLVVATDGFHETRNHHDQLLGIEQMLQAIEALPPQRSAQEISAYLFQYVETFGAGHAQEDDRTLVVLTGVA